MRHAKLHRPGSAVQAGVQLRGGCLGVGLHTLCPAGRATAVRHRHAQGDLRADLQQPLPRGGRQYREQERPGPDQVAAAIQSRAETEPGESEGARLPHEGVRAGVLAPHLLLPDATGVDHRAILGLHGRQEPTRGQQSATGERLR